MTNSPKLTLEEKIEAQQKAMELQGEMYNRYAIEGFLKKYKDKKHQIYAYWKKGTGLMRMAYKHCMMYEEINNPNITDFIFLIFVGFLSGVFIYIFLWAFCFALGGYQ